MAHVDQVEEELRRHLARNVRALREAAGFTLAKAAEAAEMHDRHLQKIEAGEVNVTFHTLARLAVAFRVTPVDLLR